MFRPTASDLDKTKISNNQAQHRDQTTRTDNLINSLNKVLITGNDANNGELTRNLQNYPVQ